LEKVKCEIRFAVFSVEVTLRQRCQFVTSFKIAANSRGYVEKSRKYLGTGKN